MSTRVEAPASIATGATAAQSRESEVEAALQSPPARAVRGFGHHDSFGSDSVGGFP